MIRNRTTLAEALQLFDLDNRARNLSPRTLEWYDWHLGMFAAWLEEDGCEHLDQLTRNHIRRFQIERAELLAADTRHGEARCIRRFCNFCVGEGLLETSPFDGITLPETPRRILDALTDAEVKAILAAAKTPRDKAIVYVLLDTGMRASELTAVTGGDVDVSQRVIRVHGKGRKERLVYLSPASVRALLRYYRNRGVPTEAEPVFLSKRHRKLTRSGMTRLMQRLADASGVPNCKAHSFRRTFALTMLRQGCDIYTLKQLMGHEDIQVLRQYLALTDADARAAHNRYSPVAALLK